ncbi:hypothetical protein [Palleronia caenipelagi]|uniref:DUF3035 domain-containing protein n=1 Tax=Palleronia caenipelagi TaxID=2489174 RepID=A0A547Q306_9RHOB|nr:hypothetical protein [Palleronia caenipelagi]TRD20762.1 hypothetical protein FEV53_09040 [Palleronia caenipelagi]
MTRLTILLPILLSACALPDINVAAPPETATRPELRPVEEIVLQLPKTSQATPMVAEDLQAQAEALEARGAALPDHAVDPAEQARLAARAERLRKLRDGG